MKKINLFASVMLSIAIILSGCNASNTAKGTAIGGGGGAAVGAGIGALLNGGKGAAWGAGIGAVVGGAAGALIGNKMDKQKKELEAIQNAKVEAIQNADGQTQAIRVTFDSGILFATNSSTLNQASITALTQFSNSLKSNPETDVQIYGHTDSTGNDKINIPLSQQRAGSVQNFLMGQGIMSSRMTAQGMGSSQPVADNSTAVGKQQNRRVEVYIIPNTQMVKDAQSGTLK
jgi:outer membrane protein OmpA-like peptidoglycan-associated protein